MAEATTNTAAASAANDATTNTTKAKTAWKIETPTPADIPRIVDVQWNAQASPRMQSLFPHSPSGRCYSERDYLRHVTPPASSSSATGSEGNDGLPPPETLMRVVRDPDGGEVVAFGVWRHMRAGDDWGWRASWSPFDDIPDMSYEVAEGIFGPARRFHRLIMEEREHLMLEILATIDTHRARGIGTALVEWGNAYADERGLATFLLASAQGKSVYEKVGFAVRDVSDLTDEKPVSIPMVRLEKQQTKEAVGM